MTARERFDTAEVDLTAVFAHLRDSAAPFHDDSSPAAVTDVLVVFAFLVGLQLAAVGPGFAAAVLCRLEEQMPAASGRARSLAQGMSDSLTVNPSAQRGPARARFGPSASV